MKFNVSKKVLSTLALSGALFLTGGLLNSSPVMADETCMSPYMAKITGQEDFVYIWTLGVEGMGDGQDKLVTVDVNPSSENYGKVINSLSVGGRNEAHHSGFTDDRKYLWAGGLDTNKIFVFDVHTDPAKPTLNNVVTDFVSASGGWKLYGLRPVPNFKEPIKKRLSEYEPAYNSCEREAYSPAFLFYAWELDGHADPQHPAHSPDPCLRRGDREGNPVSPSAPLDTQFRSSLRRQGRGYERKGGAASPSPNHEVPDQVWDDNMSQSHSDPIRGSPNIRWV